MHRDMLLVPRTFGLNVISALGPEVVASCESFTVKLTDLQRANPLYKVSICCNDFEVSTFQTVDSVRQGIESVIKSLYASLSLLAETLSEQVESLQATTASDNPFVVYAQIGEPEFRLNNKKVLVTVDLPFIDDSIEFHDGTCSWKNLSVEGSELNNLQKTICILKKGEDICRAYMQIMVHRFSTLLENLVLGTQG